jgi:hypothetical protein
MTETKKQVNTLKVPYGWPYRKHQKLNVIDNPFKGNDYTEIAKSIRSLSNERAFEPEFREATSAETISIASYSAMAGRESPKFSALRTAILGNEECECLFAGRAVKTQEGVYFNPIFNGKFVTDEESLKELRRHPRDDSIFVPYHQLPQDELIYGRRSCPRNNNGEPIWAQHRQTFRDAQLDDFINTPLARAIEHSGDIKAYGLQNLVLGMLESPYVHLCGFERFEHMGEIVPIREAKEEILCIGGGWYNGSICISLRPLPLFSPGNVYGIKNERIWK